MTVEELPVVRPERRQAKKTDDAETVDVLLLSPRAIPLTFPCFTITVRGKVAPGGGQASLGSHSLRATLYPIALDWLKKI